MLKESFFSSLLVARDVASREVLAGFGIDLRSPTSFDDLFNVLGGLDGIRGTSAKIATYRMTEGALSRPIGRFLRDAACGSQLEIVFDWCSHRRYGGITRKLVRELSLPPVDGDVRGVRYGGTPDSLFHPKLVIIGLALPSGEQLRLTVFGSANMTAAGLQGNTELGVVFAERGLPSQRSMLGWLEVHELFESWMSKAKPMTVEDLALLPDDSDALDEWTETSLPAAVRLRLYQQTAVDAIVQAWQDRYQKRPSTNWKGTLLVLPPATGKTLCALEAACRILELDEGNGPVVWLSDQPLLAAQAYEEFQRTGFLQRREIGAIGLLVKTGRIRRSTGTDDMQVKGDSSLRAWLDQDSLARRAIVFTTKADTKSLSALSSTPPGLTIVDEAHHATAPGWDKALVDLHSYLVVGLTGTPYRKSPESRETYDLLHKFSTGPQPWLSCFMPKRQAEVRNALEGAEDNKIAYGMPVASFYDQDFTGTELPVLSAPTFVPVSVVDATAGELVVVRPSGSKSQRIRFFENPFSEQRNLSELVHDPEIVEAALAAIDRDACDRAKQASVTGRTTIVFSRNVRHANILREHLENQDVAVTALHSQDDRTLQERHRELQRVRDVAGSVLVCVDMLAEGVDLPTANVLVMARWTSSERLFWQMIGRGLRGPDIGGTKDVEIVTYKLQFGDPSEDTASVQTVDDLLLEAFGKHAKLDPTTLKVDPSGGGSATVFATRDSADGGDWASRRRRQGSMLLGDIRHRESRGLDGDVFDIVIRNDSGTIVDHRDGVRQPWRALSNMYDDGRRGRKYRFVVTGRDE